MFTRIFWRDLFERSLSTSAQSALLVVGADQLNVLNADWGTVGGFAAGGFALSALKGIAARRLVGDEKSASLDPQQKILGKA